MLETRHVIMVASENDALIHGKVGGVGDVMRDLPCALAQLGFRITTIIPSYGFLQKDNPSRRSTGIRFPFSGKYLDGELWEVIPKAPCEGITHFVFEHPEVHGEPIYSNDPPGHAFARDATKYALFCSAVGQYLKTVADPFILHLHDWHMGFFLLLKELHPDFAHLKKCKSVFTIHNLAIQGTRPIRGKQSTVEQWFPELFTQTGWIEEWKDPRYEDPAFTPMAAGIQLCDKVNTVSPTYAEEILRPSDRAIGFFGGEGMERFVQQVQRESRLFGILNGAEYPVDRKPSSMSFPALCDLIVQEMGKAKEKKGNLVFDEILRRIVALKGKPPRLMLTSVTRVVDQKIRLLYEKSSRGTQAMDEILASLARKQGVCVVLGTGTTEYEEKLTETFFEHDNFLFLNFFSEEVGWALYANGTIFMMPSSFEPCGIGQMIAMRDGQPCVVHATGGLCDTVIDGVNGFRFGGTTLAGKADDFIAVTERAMRMALEDPDRWREICRKAREARFTWEKSARQYVDLLYS